MPRVRSNVARLKRKKQVMKAARGAFGARSKLWRPAKETVERGWKYASSILERYGADAHTGHDPTGWLAHWLPKLTRAVRHPGNHKYGWALTQTAAKHMPSRLPYPKFQPLFF